MDAVPDPIWFGIVLVVLAFRMTWIRVQYGPLDVTARMARALRRRRDHSDGVPPQDQGVDGP